MNHVQTSLKIEADKKITNLEEYRFEPIKGYPMLHWKGKRPFTQTQFYPAQLKETHGQEVGGWRNKIFWGDNLQVMSHLLKEFRGKVDLVYIDPPFDSKADYKKKIHLKGKSAEGNSGAFEEKQYTDIWSNDEYLQFIYNRIIIVRELLSEHGSLWFHCDWHRSHHLRCLLEEIFGINNFQNEIIWQRTDPHNDAKSRFGFIHDTVLWFAKNRQSVIYNWGDVTVELSKAALKEYSLVLLPSGSVIPWTEDIKEGRRFKLDDCTYKGKDSRRRFNWRGAVPSDKRVWPYATPKEMDDAVLNGEYYLRNKDVGAARCRVSFLDEREGQLLQTIWTDCGRMKGGVDYPTQKPEALLERIIRASSNPGDLIFDCFMGSGTTQAVALKLGRRFIGADINLGAIQTTTKRLIGVSQEICATPPTLDLTPSAPSPVPTNDKEENGNSSQAISISTPTVFYTGFEVYNVNHYDVFRNPLEAKELLIEALEIQPFSQGTSVFDGEKDGRLVKIMPVNRISTRADLGELIAGLDYKKYSKSTEERPNSIVEKILLVCMGHEPELKAWFEKEVSPLKIDVEVVDILRDKANLEFKRDSQARVLVKKSQIVIDRFYPMNLLQKLSLQKEQVEKWQELVESVMIDWNYDGVVFQPALIDIPEKDALVCGSYAIPTEAGTIRVKITDLLSESWEGTVNAD